MPTLAESRRQVDPARYQRMESPLAAQTPAASLEPVFNPTIRCPLPPLSTTPDTLRQFYRGGIIPENRIFSPPPLSGNNNNGGTSTSTTVVQTSSTSTTVLPTAKNASITTPVLNAGVSYQGVLTMAKSFILMQVSVDQPARVELYSNANFQTLDAGRMAFIGSTPNPPVAGTQHGVIADLYLDSTLSWIMSSDAVASNADNPQSVLIYITVTNISASTNSITASLAYVEQQS